MTQVDKKIVVLMVIPLLGITSTLGTIPILRPQSGWVGSEKWQLLLMFNSIYADVG